MCFRLCDKERETNIWTKISLIIYWLKYVLKSNIITLSKNKREKELRCRCSGTSNNYKSSAFEFSHCLVRQVAQGEIRETLVLLREPKQFSHRNLLAIEISKISAVSANQLPRSAQCHRALGTFHADFL